MMPVLRVTSVALTLGHPRKNLLLFALHWGGVYWRWGGYWWKIKAPWDRPLFSERYGHTPTLARFLGWRLLKENPRDHLSASAPADGGST